MSTTLESLQAHASDTAVLSMAELEAEWARVQAEVRLRYRAFRALDAGTLTRAQYASILRQVFHHARENPQLQALATVRFRGSQRDFVKPFYRHANTEVGHDQLALSDIEALGFDVLTIPDERPLPATMGLLGAAFYQVEHHDPVGYLGYLFYLEYTPTQIGPSLLQKLAAAGMPDTAMSFVHEHATVDVTHCRLIASYVSGLVKTASQRDSVLYMLRTTADLYGKMLDAALDDTRFGS